MFRSGLLLSCALAAVSSANAADQRTPGAGNERAIEIARASKQVKKAHDFLLSRARSIRDEHLRRETLELLLAKLAPEFGFAKPAKTEDPTRFNTLYRNVMLSQLSAERILLRYAEGGLPVVRSELQALRARHGF